MWAHNEGMRATRVETHTAFIRWNIYCGKALKDKSHIPQHGTVGKLNRMLLSL